MWSASGRPTAARRAPSRRAPACCPRRSRPRCRRSCPWTIRAMARQCGRRAGRGWFGDAQRCGGHGRIVGQRRDGHQAVDLEVRPGERTVQQAGGVGGGRAGFGGIMAGVNLQQHGKLAAEFPGGAVEDGEQFLTVHALDAPKMSGRQLRALLDWRWPMSSQRTMAVAHCARLSTASCTRFSPTAAQAVAGGVVDGGGGVGLGHRPEASTSCGSRPDRRHDTTRLFAPDRVGA
jgi:hypothetical protein